MQFVSLWLWPRTNVFTHHIRTTQPHVLSRHWIDLRTRVSPPAPPCTDASTRIDCPVHLVGTAAVIGVHGPIPSPLPKRTPFQHWHNTISHDTPMRILLQKRITAHTTQHALSRHSRNLHRRFSHAPSHHHEPIRLPEVDCPVHLVGLVVVSSLYRTPQLQHHVGQPSIRTGPSPPPIRPRRHG